MSLDTFLDDLDELASDDEAETKADGGGLDSELAADLDDLDSDDDGDGGGGAGGGAGGGGGGGSSSSSAAPGLDSVLGAALGGRVTDVVSLSTSDRFKQHMAAIDEALASAESEHLVGPVDEDPEYKLVVASNDIAVEIEDEMSAVHKFTADTYAAKFPELETMVPNALDYCRVVERIGNEMDMTLVDLGSMLPPSQVMVVSVTGSTTNGQKLSEETLERCLEGCALMQQLETSKTKILRFVESRMSRIAPNLAALLGSEVSAALMGFAGGLTALSKIPACNLQVMGQKKRTLGGFSQVAAMKHCGMIYHAPLVQSCPVPLRQKAVRVLGGKVALAARSDTFQSARDGSVGRAFHGAISTKIEKWQEAPPARTKKALKKPDDMPSRKRGGKRHRRQKERFGLTDVHKEASRMGFANMNDEYGDAAMGLTLGSLGKEGSGRLRQMTSQRQKKQQKKEAKQQKKVAGGGSYGGGSASTTSGLSSSLAFTPVQGLELQNPNAAADRVRAANAKYFGANGGFSSVKPK